MRLLLLFTNTDRLQRGALSRVPKRCGGGTLTRWYTTDCDSESGTFRGRQRMRVAVDQCWRAGSIAAVAAATASKVGLA